MYKINKIKKKKIFIYYIEENTVKNNKILNFINNILSFKNSFVYESVEKGKIRGRYTIFGYDPDLILETYNKKIFKNNILQKTKDPIKFLNNTLKFLNFKLPEKLPPMSVMLNGYIGYDAIRYVEKLPNNCKDDLKIPDVKLIRPRKILIHDNLKKKNLLYLY